MLRVHPLDRAVPVLLGNGILVPRVPTLCPGAFTFRHRLVLVHQHILDLQHVQVACSTKLQDLPEGPEVLGNSCMSVTLAGISWELQSQVEQRGCAVGVPETHCLLQAAQPCLQSASAGQPSLLLPLQML